MPHKRRRDASRTKNHPAKWLTAADKLLAFCSSAKRRTFREGVFPKRNIQRAAGHGRGIIEIDAAAPVVANAIRRAIASCTVRLTEMFAGEPEVE
jgi:hypothetical protein